MTQLLGLVILSFIVTSFFMVPFIDLLFYLKRRFEKIQREKQEKSETPIHDQLMKGDLSTPSGGGILLILILVILSLGYALFSSQVDKVSLLILLFILTHYLQVCQYIFTMRGIRYIRGQVCACIMFKMQSIYK